MLYGVGWVVGNRLECGEGYVPTQIKPYNTPPRLNSGVFGLPMGPYVPTPKF